MVFFTTHNERNSVASRVDELKALGGIQQMRFTI